MQHNYRPAIDGLRAFAVISVLIFHLNENWLPGGFVGVDVFFVISGYLITQIIHRDCTNNSFSLTKFYQRRIARIFPAFFVVALGTLIAAYFIYSNQDLASAGANLAAAALSISNLKLMMQGSYFEISPDAQPYLHYWSLSIEEQFYLFYPATFLFLHAKLPRWTLLLLICCTLISFAACVALTVTRPTWAFYLLPTRGFELLAGCALAVYNCSHTFKMPERFKPSFPTLGLVIILASFLIINGDGFPGYKAALPVVGAICVLGSLTDTTHNLGERILSWRPTVLVGRMSYSLYLWHWPVYSFVDYKLLFSSPATRLAWKIGLTFVGAASCYLVIERPARTFLNRRESRSLAFGFFVIVVTFSVLLGATVRRMNYVNAEVADVANGGLIFEPTKPRGSIVLLGDSHGAMYGKMMKELAAEMNLKFTMLGVAAADPLPSDNSPEAIFWPAALKVIQRDEPDVVVLVCDWVNKLKSDRKRVDTALGELNKVAGHIVLITQPPQEPIAATRQSLREGSRPPFLENPVSRKERMDMNDFINSRRSSQVAVLDIESHFADANGEVQCYDMNGRAVYHDRSHLSGIGADRVKADLRTALLGLGFGNVADQEHNISAPAQR
jgi:peptidoglycan/LPS O-acetylase OafA/YrhL